MKSLLFRRSSRADGKGEKETNAPAMFSQEKITASSETTSPVNTSMSSPLDASSKMSVSELGSRNEGERKQVGAVTEQPGLMLASEDDITPKAINDKEIVDEDEKKFSSYDAESSTNATLPAYQEHASPIGAKTSLAENSKRSLPSSDEKPDLLSQDLTRPDGMEKEVAMPTSTRTGTNLSSFASSAQLSRTYREYNFYYTNAMTHLIICDPDQQALFFAESSSFTKGKSDIHLHDVANSPDSLSYRGTALSYKEAQGTQVVATADFVQANNIKIGLGDPLQPEAAKWMMMRNVYNDTKHNVEKYEVLAPGSGSQAKEVVYQWVKGVAHDNGGKKSGDRGNAKDTFKMLSDHGVVASFRNASATSFKKRGYLRIFETPAVDDILLLIFVSFVALCEKRRRRTVKKSLLLGS